MKQRTAATKRCPLCGGPMSPRNAVGVCSATKRCVTEYNRRGRARKAALLALGEGI